MGQHALPSLQQACCCLQQSGTSSALTCTPQSMRTNIVAIAVESNFLMGFLPCGEFAQDHTEEEADLQKETALDKERLASL